MSKARTYSCPHITFPPPLPRNRQSDPISSAARGSQVVCRGTRATAAILPHTTPSTSSMRTQQGCQVHERVHSCTSTFPAQRVKSPELSPVACHLSPPRPKSLAPAGTITTLAALAKCCRMSVAYKALGLRERIKFSATAYPVYELSTPDFAFCTGCRGFRTLQITVWEAVVHWYFGADEFTPSKFVCVHASPRGTSQ